jgi:hypothetical protein
MSEKYGSRSQWDGMRREEKNSGPEKIPDCVEKSAVDSSSTAETGPNLTTAIYIQRQHY